MFGPTSSYVTVDLRLQVVVAHQPRAQRLAAVVGALRVEHAAMPLRLDVLDHACRRHGADELQVDGGPALT